MHQFDLAFRRLASAWSPVSTKTTGAEGSAGQIDSTANHPPTHPPIHLAASPTVMITRGMKRLPAVFDIGRLVSPRDPECVYRLEPTVVAGLDELEQLCHLHAPRVLLVDIGLIHSAGVDAVQHLRRRLPATDWILGFDPPLATEIEPALFNQTRGCISWAADPDHLARALDAVLAGGLWFPRSVMQTLYLWLLEAGAPGCKSPPASGWADDLTSRETEVLALMRRGLTNRQIAERLSISCNTVKKHLAHIFEKRGLHGRRQECD
jgi:DNA-binding NarL/FixJ family response regulator